MEHSDLLRFVAMVLERLGLAYFVTGSTATIFYGEPRFTNDIDIVVELPDSRVADFCTAFPHDEYYLSEEAAREAVRRKSQFNIIHPASGLKVDVIVPELNAFNALRFTRAKRLRVGEDCEVSFTTLEDAIIMKMAYYRQRRSEKHLRDVTGVLKISPAQVDGAYITLWSRLLDLEDIWTAIQKRLNTGPE